MREKKVGVTFVCIPAPQDNPELELKPGLDLVGPVLETFFDTYNLYEPCNEWSLDNCFISKVHTTRMEHKIQQSLKSLKRKGDL